ncbi:glycosyl transferase [Spongiactinospora gelatinilytica]|uniref:Glycosyl transferase n=1 Tax=Spongiactinospora gelatinilytica TaxID=2666298 RepID=A0A2W2F4Z3_9ACTN|nr:glycosyl transferase [Spongiactinospora gelatinilytica]
MEQRGDGRPRGGRHLFDLPRDAARAGRLQAGPPFGGHRTLLGPPARGGLHLSHPRPGVHGPQVGPATPHLAGADRLFPAQSQGAVARLPPERTHGAGVNSPRIRHNDYSILSPPEIGDRQPYLPVSVVIAAYRHQDKLDLTLAALAAQSYPAHLLEVIVVDDGTDPPLTLGQIRPENTRLLRTTPDSRGRSNARNAALEVAEGHVIHWLDADMVTHHDEVEAHMRWHHLADYLVVMGYVRYVDEEWPGPAEVHAAVSAGAGEKLFDLDASEPHQWIVDLAESTDGMRTAKNMAYRVHITNAASVNARLLRAAGPLATELVLGEDTELGYRLAQHGAAFVLEPAARSWHLGRSMMMRDREQVTRYNAVFVPDLVPHMRWQRTHPRRQYMVPYLDVAVEAAGATYEDIRATVDGVLASDLPDVRVTLAGPWGALAEDRRAPQHSPNLDLLLIHGLYRNEPRVRFVDRTPRSAAPVPYRLLCPPGWVPRPNVLRRLLAHAAEHGYGLVSIALDETDVVVTARLEHTGAFARARLLAGPGEALDDVVEEVAGTYWLDGATWGFQPATDAKEPKPDTSGAGPGRAEAGRLKTENERLALRVAQLTEELDRLRAERASSSHVRRRRLFR